MGSRLVGTFVLGLGLSLGVVSPIWADDAPYPSTYQPLPSTSVLLQNGTLLDGLGGQTANADLLINDGKISAVGPNLSVPEGTRIIDATGKWITPGIIDIHSHLGVYPAPGVQAHNDGNEVTNPVTAEVWSEHGIWPQDPGFNRARTGGITSLLVLPGSANLFGGRGVVLKNVPSRTVQGMKFPGAPYALKMACGENPKRVYGEKGGPGSRMGNFSGYRKTWIKAVAYREKWAKYKKELAKAKPEDEKQPSEPDRDLQMETLVGVLNGDIRVNMHCYRADEMAQVIDLSKEFGYKVSTFHHAIEAYKISDLLKENGICAAMWADWGGFKMEAYDSIRENIPMVHHAGGCAIVHSDSEVGIQRLYQEAAKALADGRKAGLDISKGQAWRWLSSNPANAMGIGDQTGSLTVGKDADIVLWDGDPFSIRTRAELVLIDGALLYDKNDRNRQAVSDFELGQPGNGEEK
ncbi:MAG: amidohydrolase [Robiginitomaculum sp.]|nr:MAG: amidohydrolase [Robiginitomaculum sp.]